MTILTIIVLGLLMVIEIYLIVSWCISWSHWENEKEAHRRYGGKAPRN